MSTLEAREQRILPIVGSNSCRARHDMDDIVATVCAASGFDRRYLLSRPKARHICDIRQLAIMLCRMLTKKSYPKIGDYFNREYSTAIHAVRKFEAVEILLYQRVPKDAPTHEWVTAAFEAAREVFPMFGKRGLRW